MEKIKFNVYYIVYYILILSMIIQDLPLALTYGEYVRTPTGILSILVFVPILLRKGLKFKIKSTNEKICLFVLTSYFLVNIIFLIGFGPSFSLGNESMFSKTIKGSLYIWSMVIFYYDLYYLNRKLSKSQMLKPFVTMFFLLIIILVIEILNHHAFDALHCHTEYGKRIRLLCPEASNTALLILGSFIPTVYYYYSKKRTLPLITSIILMIVQLYFTGSKSLMVCFGIIFIFTILFYKKMSGPIRLLGIIACIVALCMITPTLFGELNNDIENYTSVSTRLFTTLVAIIFSFIFPFGVGSAIYLKYYPEMMFNYAPTFISMTGFNSAEIYGLINSTTDQAVGAKSGIGTLCLYFGIIGTLLIIYMLFKFIYKANKEKKIISFSLLVLILFGLLTFGIDNNYMLIAILFISLAHLKNFGNTYSKNADTATYKAVLNTKLIKK